MADMNQQERETRRAVRAALRRLADDVEAGGELTAPQIRAWIDDEYPVQAVTRPRVVCAPSGRWYQVVQVGSDERWTIVSSSSCGGVATPTTVIPDIDRAVVAALLRYPTVEVPSE